MLELRIRHAVGDQDPIEQGLIGNSDECDLLESRLAIEFPQEPYERLRVAMADGNGQTADLEEMPSTARVPSEPTITPEISATQERGKFRVKLSTDKFAKAVYLAVPDHDGFFSDNYFNLAPGREMVVEFRSRRPISLEEFRKRLQIRSVFDAF